MKSSSKGVLLFCILFIVQDASCQLQSACRHNEFRCSDGSKCLSTEKLCNGKKDCPRGEDERGSAQWDCSKQTLSTSCDAITEYKCRYGGCIPRVKLCDGTPDCWGANDEATDVCARRKPTQTRPSAPAPRPASQATTRRPVQTTPPPPPVQQRPRPKPVSSYPPPPPVNSGSGCPPLEAEELDGFDISCVDAYNRNVECKTVSAPIGSKARYRCKPYYNPTSTGGRQTERTCQDNGQWTTRRSSFICILSCGEGGAESVALITGGIQSQKGKWPWHVALYHEDPPNSGQFEFFCGGSLINTKVVLTAAHCVTKKGTEITRSTAEIRVVVGKFYRTYKRREETEQEVGVREINVNEDYNSYNLDNDIALVRLDKPVSVGNYVRPVCLPTNDDKNIYDTTSHYGQLVGWGRTSNGKFKDALQEAKLPLVRSAICKEAHPTFAGLVRSTTFCAGYRNGTSACDGDSGGGYMLPDNDGRKIWRVQGIVSAGVANPGGGCKDRYYAVFTKVGEYLQWIHTKLDHEYRK